MLDARVEQFYALDQAVPFTGDWGSGQDTIRAEQLSVQAPDTKVLLRYARAMAGWTARSGGCSRRRASTSLCESASQE